MIVWIYIAFILNYVMFVICLIMHLCKREREDHWEKPLWKPSSLSSLSKLSYVKYIKLNGGKTAMKKLTKLLKQS